MKLKLLPLILFLSFFIKSNAQYDSLVKPGKKWYYTLFDGERNWPRGITEISRTTVSYNGKTYYSLINPSPCYLTTDTMLIREENKRVYSVILGNSIFHGQERILYDFNLEKGDSFKFSSPAGRDFREFPDSVLNITFHVDTTFYVNNRKEIRFKYLFTPQHVRSITWLEGIGNESGWLGYSYHRLGYELSESSCGLVQVCDENLKIHPNGPGQCNEAILSVDFNNYRLSVYPIPTQNNITLKLPNTELYQITIFNVNGKVVKEIELEGNENYEISMGYPKGMYYLNATNRNLKSFNTMIVVD
jgi:hypothetical protein